MPIKKAFNTIILLTHGDDMLKNITNRSKSWVFILGAFFAICCGSAMSETTDPIEQVVPQSSSASLTPDQEKLHQELRDLKATMTKALNSMDIETIAANVTEDVVFTTMNDDVAHGSVGIKEYFEEMMKGPNRRVISVNSNFEADGLSHIYNDNIAIAYGTSNGHYELVSAGSIDVKARWSSTMVRRDGRWLIANFHYSTNMFDNPVLDAQRKFMLIAGVVGAILLGLCAFWLGLARGRRVGK